MYVDAWKQRRLFMSHSAARRQRHGTGHRLVADDVFDRRSCDELAQKRASEW